MECQLALFSDIEALCIVRVLISTAEKLAKDRIVSGESISILSPLTSFRIYLRFLHAFGLNMPASKIVL